jgi:CubicO group peptidase (beta-lactamase class C family)
MKLFAVLLPIVFLAACSVAPQRPATVGNDDYAAVKSYVSQLIAHEMGQNKVPGLSIALVDDQRVVWAQGFGFTDLENRVPATPQTLYRVASISKLFTATAAMQMSQTGQLDIDQPLQNYLPGFSIKTRQPQAPITLRQLMTHHSGLPGDRFKGFQNPQPRPFAELVNEVADEYSSHVPDLLFSYTNLGVTLLGAAIEKQSGVPFARHMQQAVLTPLGMTSSAFDTGPSGSPLMAKGYRGQDAVPETPLRDVPAGGLNSSVIDLSRFMAMVFADGMSGDQQILQPQTLAEMLRPQNRNVALDFNFQVGLGWMLSTLGQSTTQNGGLVAHHAGAIGMFRSQMYILPKHKLGVVVLANSGTAAGVVDHIATQTLQLALEAKAGIRQPQSQKVEWAKESLSPERALDFAGYYSTVAGPAKVIANGQRLQAQLAGKKFDLRLRADGWLGLDYELLGFIPVDLGSLGDIGLQRRLIDGRQVLVARLGEQEMLVGQAIEPPATLGAWAQRLGDYEISNLDGDLKVMERIRLFQEDGFLMLELQGGEQMPRTLLMPLSDTEARLVGTLADMGSTVRSVVKGGVEQLGYSGYLASRRSGAAP